MPISKEILQPAILPFALECSESFDCSVKKSCGPGKFRYSLSINAGCGLRMPVFGTCEALWEEIILRGA
jgi:hypothetical protein